MPSGRRPDGEAPMSNAERQARCHVRFQGAWAQNSTRFFSFRLNFVLMQACAVGGGH
jgi:hypothetical protein